MEHFPTIFVFNRVDSFDELKVNMPGKFLRRNNEIDRNLLESGEITFPL